MPPIVGEDAKVLILGSMPGKVALQTQRYYNNKGNRFWSLLFGYFNTPITNDYEVRKDLVTKNGIALWDVLECCERGDTSADKDIMDGEPINLEDFLKEKKIKAILLKGGKAHEEFQKHFKQFSSLAIPLPSTSGGNGWWGRMNGAKAWTDSLDKLL
ncbi:MAG: DNA-deoxyinosine glycosylase [Salinivirgaceae bacterium]|nr:DNA-deoxyinosine glycosylase [Salinivirgaceae bacterium]